MSWEAGKAPDQSGDAGVPVQQAHEAVVPEEWLREVGHVDLADSIDRLAADVSLVTDLALENYDGPLWEYFSNELAKYGIAVMAAWLGQGQIWQRCESRGFGKLPVLGRPFSDEETDALTWETVALAMNKFRTDVLMTNRWDHRRGASIRTFFIGQCLIRFPNIYRKWLTAERAQRRYEMTTEDYGFLEDSGGSRPGPAAQVIDQLTALDVIATIKNPQVRRAMVLTSAGWPQAEVAEVLHVTEKAVERMIANERERQRRRRRGA